MESAPPSLDHLRIDRSSPRRRESSRGVWIALFLLLFTIGGGIYWWLQRPRAIEVQTVIVQAAASSGSGRTLLNASGYVTARRAATVSSKVTGKVIEILVEEGMKVEEAQVLARLDATNVEASLHFAEAQLQAAQTMLDETKPNLDFARREWKRFTDLAGGRVVSDSDLRRAEMEARALEARLARQTAEVGVRQSEIAQWKQQIDDTIIRAPFGGVVISKNAQPGEMISPMSVGGFTRTGICTIVDMGSLEIEVDVSESYIQRVEAGQRVEATLDAYSDWKIPARVIAIIPTADRQKATVKVRVAFGKLDPRILPDMGVKVAFQAAATDAAPARSGIRVPDAAVQNIDGLDVAWIVRDGRVERRAVSIGSRSAGEVEITAGLNAGEHLVLNAPRELTDGSRVSEKNNR